MSLENEIRAGFAAANSFAGEPFTMSNHTGIFRGVFRGDTAPTSFDLQGYDVKTTNALTISKRLFTANNPPIVNERVTSEGGDVYTVTAIESPDGANYDLQLQKVNA